ncbi:DUF3817 domain-containing protein [Micrococcus porci]|uniref:DUF3817 domain-containing protein n=1 Tax=Micrococcus porci TaxID=2856555 RepID=UPI001CC9A28C|nr:DUF3817 domain-containing protein [Micrococcus porci]UBH25624.1 DUF3817 domain-containing protein [Micrococcus porci]
MRVPGPRSLYRATAVAEMATWTLLLLAMALKYGGVTAALMPAAGGVHGFVFLCYAAVVVAVWIDGRWGVGRGLLALGSAVVPYMTVPMERALLRRGEPAPRWRVLEEAGRTSATDRLLRTVLRRPRVSALAVLVAVVVVFSLLLRAGPPTEWFSR